MGEGEVEKTLHQLSPFFASIFLLSPETHDTQAISIFPTRPRFLRWSAIIPDKLKTQICIVGDVGDGFRTLPIP